VASDDPLDTWCKYVAWTEQHSTSVNLTELRGLLEEATQGLQAHARYPQYKRDQRYLTLWIKYVRRTLPCEALRKRWHPKTHRSVSRSIQLLTSLSVSHSPPHLCRDHRPQADLFREPEEIFKFLQENDIGQDWSLFYLAYAVVSETRHNFQRATQLYDLGLHRYAFTPVAPRFASRPAPQKASPQPSCRTATPLTRALSTDPASGGAAGSATCTARRSSR
jgi:hypothetical protein